MMVRVGARKGEGRGGSIAVGEIQANYEGEFGGLGVEEAGGEGVGVGGQKDGLGWRGLGRRGRGLSLRGLRWG